MSGFFKASQKTQTLFAESFKNLRSKKDKRPFNELMQYYAMERFLYRLSQSDYADSFILEF